MVFKVTEKRIQYWKSMKGKSHGHKTSNGGGWKHTDETKEKMSKSMTPTKLANLTYRIPRGHISWNNGVTGYSTTLKGIKRLDQTGEKHPRWIKDRTLLKDDHRDRGGSLHRDWSRRVKERDKFCRIADVNCDGRLEAHHILGWTKFPELRYEINNGITLCHAHHPRTRADEAKLLSPYFKKLVAEMNQF